MKKVIFALIVVFGMALSIDAQELGIYKLGQDFSDTDHVGCRKFMPFQSGENVVLIDLGTETEVIGITFGFGTKKEAKILASNYMHEPKFKKTVYFEDKGNVRYGTQRSGYTYIVTVIDMSKKDQLGSSVPDRISTPKPSIGKKPTIGGLWESDNFVDEFGDKVGELYYSLPYVTGEFSNSATVGSNMSAKILITKNKIMFKLFEYDNSPVAGDDVLTILVKDSEGIKTTFTGEQRGEYIIVGYYYDNSRGFRKFKPLLEKGGEMKIVIKDKYRTTYKFTINTDGFVDAFPSKPWEK